MANNSNKWKELESGGKEWSLRKVSKENTKKQTTTSWPTSPLTTAMSRGEQHGDTASKQLEQSVTRLSMVVYSIYNSAILRF